MMQAAILSGKISGVKSAYRGGPTGSKGPKWYDHVPIQA